jgi:hypothetical protein
MLAAPPPGVTATASADCAGGTGSIAGYPAGENHTAFLTLTYGDETIQTTAQFQQTWNGSRARPANWPSDAIWWVAVSVDSAQAEAFAAARVPLECRLPRPPQIIGIQPGPSRVSLSWFQQGTLAVSDYVIQHSLDGSAWSNVADGVSAATSYRATGLTNNVNHFFRIAAVGANGQGAFGNPVVARPVALPTAPRAVTATAGPGSITARWQAPTSGVPSYYRVQYSRDRATWTDRFVSGTPSLRITGLTPGVRYHVRVMAVNASGEGLASAVASAIPTAPRAPLAPIGVFLSDADPNGDAIIFVEPDFDGGARITKTSVRCASSNGGATRAGSSTGPSPYSVLLPAMTKLKTYRCTATLSNRVGTSPARTSAAFLMPTLPGRPTGVTVAVAGGNVTVNFTKLTGPNPISFYRATCPSSNGGSTAFGTISASSPATIRVFGWTSGKRYTCRVEASNLVGLGPASAASAAFTTP